MAAPKSPNHNSSSSDGEWELINDDGFVYKRKKRRLDPTLLARHQPDDPVPDPLAEVKEKKKRKRKALLKIKEKYEREIVLWEQLSSSLKSMEESVKSNVEERTKIVEEERERKRKSDGGDVVLMEGRKDAWVAELLLQVEAQQAIINNFSHLCEVAESLCDAQEEKSRNVFCDLPVWGSPHELMASLCED